MKYIIIATFLTLLTSCSSDEKINYDAQVIKLIPEVEVGIALNMASTAYIDACLQGSTKRHVILRCNEKAKSYIAKKLIPKLKKED